MEITAFISISKRFGTDQRISHQFLGSIIGSTHITDQMETIFSFCHLADCTFGVCDSAFRDFHIIGKSVLPIIRKTIKPRVSCQPVSGIQILFCKKILSLLHFSHNVRITDCFNQSGKYFFCYCIRSRFINSRKISSQI